MHFSHASLFWTLAVLATTGCKLESSEAESNGWFQKSKQDQLQEAMKSIQSHNLRITKEQEAWNRVDGLIKKCVEVRKAFNPKNPVFPSDPELTDTKCASYVAERTRLGNTLMTLRNEVVSYQDDIANLQIEIKGELVAQAQTKYDASRAKLQEKRTAYLSLAQNEWASTGCKDATSTSDAYLKASDEVKRKCLLLSDRVKYSQDIYSRALLESQNALIELNNAKNFGKNGPVQPKLTAPMVEPTCPEESFCGPFTETDRTLCRKYTSDPKICDSNAWNKKFYEQIHPAAQALAQCPADSYCGPFTEAERATCRKYSQDPAICNTDRWNKAFWERVHARAR